MGGIDRRKLSINLKTQERILAGIEGVVTIDEEGNPSNVGSHCLSIGDETGTKICHGSTFQELYQIVDKLGQYIGKDYEIEITLKKEGMPSEE